MVMANFKEKTQCKIDSIVSNYSDILDDLTKHAEKYTIDTIENNLGKVIDDLKSVARAGTNLCINEINEQRIIEAKKNSLEKRELN